MKNIRLFRPAQLAAAAAGALLATFSAAPSAQAQNSVTTWAQSYGCAAYDPDGTPNEDNQNGTGYDAPYGIAPMPDGGVVVAGRLGLFKYANYANPYEAGAAIIRYDRGGTIVWQTLLRQNNDTTKSDGTVVPAISHLYQLRADATGNLFVAGGTGNNDNGGELPFVAKFAPDGKLVWQSGVGDIEYKVGTNSDGTPILEPGGTLETYTMDLTSDGGVVIGTGVYARDSYHNQTYIPQLVKFNADGTLGFHREYSIQIQYSSVICVCEAAGGKGYVMLLAPNPSNPANTNRPNVDVVLTDAAGNPVSQRTFLGADAKYITRDASGGYLMQGKDRFGRPVVRKLRADLTPVWQKYLDATLTFSRDLLPTSDGGCILGCVYASAVVGGTNDHASVLLLRLNASGTVSAAHFLGGTVGESVSGGDAFTPDLGLHTCLTTDGAVAFACATGSYGAGTENRPDWWIVKANSYGQVPNFADTLFDAAPGLFGTGVSDETTSIVSKEYGAGPTNEYSGPGVGTEPAFILEDLAKETGLNKPTIKVQAKPRTGPTYPAFFQGDVELDSTTNYLAFPGGNVFGYYGLLKDLNIIFHLDLGYEYVFDAQDGHSGVFFYDYATKGYFYTSPSFPFPYMYDFKLKSTVYYYPDPTNPGRYDTKGIRYFYVFNTGKIISK